MKRIILMMLFIVTTAVSKAQVEFDLSNFISTTETIPLDFKKTISIKNMALDPTYSYSYEVSVITVPVPPFNIAALAGADCTNRAADANNQAYQLAKKNLKNERDEKQIEALLKKLTEAIKKLDPSLDQGCIDEGNSLITATHLEKGLPIPELKNNQVITVTVKRISTTQGAKSVTWVKVFKTPEKTRWLIHYGLSYAPSLISKVDHYHSLADTGIANRYTVTKDNKNGPKSWENISATINFTYPFHGDSRNFDGGFTAGFGISAGLELSGHAGISAIIGENVIISSGIAFIQKQKLKGQYKEGQIIKENLSFDALHEKVWMPEIFFTIGFRFGSNPFVKKSSSDSKPAASTTSEE